MYHDDVIFGLMVFCVGGAMAHNPNSSRGKGAPGRTSPDDPYCEFKDDNQRRLALISRDVRMVGCRLLTVVGIVVLAFYAPAGSLATLIARMLGRL